MADITHQKLLDAINGVESRLDAKIDGVETRIDRKLDNLTEMVAGIGDTLAGVVNRMATIKDLKRTETKLIAKFDTKLDSKIDDLELRIGRRIDKVYLGKYEH